MFIYTYFNMKYIPIDSQFKHENTIKIPASRETGHFPITLEKALLYTGHQAIIGHRQLSDTVGLYQFVWRFSAHARIASISPGEGVS